MARGQELIINEATNNIHNKKTSWIFSARKYEFFAPRISARDKVVSSFIK